MKRAEPRGFWRTYAPTIAPVALALSVGGLISAVRLQTIQEEKVAELQVSVEQLRIQAMNAESESKKNTERIDRMDTPLSHHVIELEADVKNQRSILQGRLDAVEREARNNTYSNATDRDLIENLAGRVISIEQEERKRKP